MSSDFLEWRQNIQVANRLHLNHAGVSPMSMTVAKAIKNALVSQHLDGPLQEYIKMFDAVNSVRSLISSLMGVQASDVGLTRNTSHSMSIIANGLRLGKGAEVIVGIDEFPGVVYPWLPLQRDGVTVTRINPSGKTFSADDYIEAFSDETRVVIVSWIHWCTGSRIDVDKIVKAAQAREIIVICDTIQGLGAIPVDFTAPAVDFIIGGSHKWLTCPSGLGYIAASPSSMARLKPTNIGWNSVTNSLNLDALRPNDLKDCAAIIEEGNPSFLTIVGCQAALSELCSHSTITVGDRILLLAKSIATELSTAGWTLQCDTVESGIVSAIPSGSTMRAAAKLDSSGIDIAIRAGAIRFSPHAYQNLDDFQRLFELL